MTIDTTGEWWKGSEYADIPEYLRALEPGGYSVDEVVQARCRCGGTQFRLHVDRDNELAQTICVACDREAFVSDSGDHWHEASPELRNCPCGQPVCEIGLGLCIREASWVRWMSVGVRCVACGVLVSPLDWKSDAQRDDASAMRIAG